MGSSEADPFSFSVFRDQYVAHEHLGIGIRLHSLLHTLAGACAMHLPASVAREIAQNPALNC
jgi:hypothetical protein